MSIQRYTFVYATIVFVSGAYTLNPPKKLSTTTGEYVHCDWCRPGEYMSRPCTVQSPTVCLPCPREHYAEQYNHLSECHPCHQCNVTDHEHENLSCTAVQNRQCECDDGYFKSANSPVCLQHTKCPRGTGVTDKGTHRTNTRCMRCRPGTFSGEISSTAECRAHTDCAARGKHVFIRGNRRWDNVCATVTMRASCKRKRRRKGYNIKEQHDNKLLIDDNGESNKMLISSEKFQLYNTHRMEALECRIEAERIAIDLCRKVEEKNTHLKNQVESEKGKVARLKDQIASLTIKNTYGMSRKPCGVAVIINNIHFEDMATRDGAEGDTDRLREAFESLGFTAMTFIDLDHSKMVASIKDQGKTDHSNYDCFVCCVMSHGTTGKVFSSDDVGIDICELMKTFNANKCPSLKGKPKLFFIQACQGKKIQGKECVEVDLDATPGDDVPLNFICHEADFFLGLSTVPGYVARRDQDGAPYVQHLAKLLKDFGPSHDLLAIMAMVCDKMNDINDDKCGWISSNHSTLRKKVFFNTK
ncbi:caspase-8-like [Branchiostoma floridae]|uniref:Caspase-8-like n=1 Tax=Branchiostoma floridae TaxID=7739 RepID=A0A9J7NCY1_BRAFL|nr:caspase-8-like [Branchiostoma floridae]